ncbi:uncharacterized protein MONOS_1637 [Monocercomonoides exilis]|uniref:uncharacterized protein n=1 Tax=Monocercomonoides exilis TaxID=2049356 RepID=UPI00355A3783|nr:hypothetical protein MONOS_1637 [Monocercomonoides exilis]|eukprot:MONOS_1637.1-p1 / transcript=MONOS_1637.1 / gene=MONOS_1637 / organism=Monocercomonoides_exilis_PA203 / gene_product=unspecified product / transcript_product=unspecified product / location=Mono_scaffold00030:49503-54976(-) / protein_length=1360 / sequence_SO=supercontig / SO=protein_coding / is_pseudo=false
MTTVDDEPEIEELTHTIDIVSLDLKSSSRITLSIQTKISSIATFTQKNNGELYSEGSNAFGQCGHPIGYRSAEFVKWNKCVSIPTSRNGTISKISCLPLTSIVFFVVIFGDLTPFGCTSSNTLTSTWLPLALASPSEEASDTPDFPRLAMLDDTSSQTLKVMSVDYTSLIHYFLRWPSALFALIAAYLTSFSEKNQKSPISSHSFQQTTTSSSSASSSKNDHSTDDENYPVYFNSQLFLSTLAELHLEKCSRHQKRETCADSSFDGSNELFRDLLNIDENDDDEYIDKHNAPKKRKKQKSLEQQRKFDNKETSITSACSNSLCYDYETSNKFSDESSEEEEEIECKSTFESVFPLTKERLLIQIRDFNTTRKKEALQLFRALSTAKQNGIAKDKNYGTPTLRRNPPQSNKNSIFQMIQNGGFESNLRNVQTREELMLLLNVYLQDSTNVKKPPVLILPAPITLADESASVKKLKHPNEAKKEVSISRVDLSEEKEIQKFTAFTQNSPNPERRRWGQNLLDTLQISNSKQNIKKLEEDKKSKLQIFEGGVGLPKTEHVSSSSAAAAAAPFSAVSSPPRNDLLEIPKINLSSNIKEIAQQISTENVENKEILTKNDSQFLELVGTPSKDFNQKSIEVIDSSSDDCFDGASKQTSQTTQEFKILPLPSTVHLSRGISLQTHTEANNARGHQTEKDLCIQIKSPDFSLKDACDLNNSHHEVNLEQKISANSAISIETNGVENSNITERSTELYNDKQTPIASCSGMDEQKPIEIVAKKNKTSFEPCDASIKKSHSCECMRKRKERKVLKVEQTVEELNNEENSDTPTEEYEVNSPQHPYSMKDIVTLSDTPHQISHSDSKGSKEIIVSDVTSPTLFRASDISTQKRSSIASPLCSPLKTAEELSIFLEDQKDDYQIQQKVMKNEAEHFRALRSKRRTKRNPGEIADSSIIDGLLLEEGCDEKISRKKFTMKQKKIPKGRTRKNKRKDKYDDYENDSCDSDEDGDGEWVPTKDEMQEMFHETMTQTLKRRKIDEELADEIILLASKVPENNSQMKKEFSDGENEFSTQRAHFSSTIEQDNDANVDEQINKCLEIFFETLTPNKRAFSSSSSSFTISSQHIFPSIISNIEGSTQNAAFLCEDGTVFISGLIYNSSNELVETPPKRIPSASFGDEFIVSIASNGILLLSISSQTTGYAMLIQGQGPKPPPVFSEKEVISFKMPINSINTPLSVFILHSSVVIQNGLSQPLIFDLNKTRRVRSPPNETLNHFIVQQLQFIGQSSNLASSSASLISPINSSLSSLLSNVSANSQISTSLSHIPYLARSPAALDGSTSTSAFARSFFYRRDITLITSSAGGLAVLALIQ